jgi:hypothetical protein
MKGCQRNPWFTRAVAGCCCLFAVGVTWAVGETRDDTESSGTAAAGTAPDTPPDEGQQQDLLDRLFSPLDEAVSDINRNLNKGDDNASPESSE